jgi:hypothetical protein
MQARVFSLRLIAFSLLFGLIATLSSAVWLLNCGRAGLVSRRSIRSEPMKRTEYQGDLLASSTGLDISIYEPRFYDDVGWIRFDISMKSASRSVPRVSVRDCLGPPSILSVPKPETLYFQCRLGFPFRSFACGGACTWGTISETWGWCAVAMRAGSEEIRLPTRPLWLGLLGNMLSSTALPPVTFFGLGFIRHRLRTRRGHCPACNYDLRADLAAGCPECGWNREPTKT